MGKVISINMSSVKGVEKDQVEQAVVIENWGLENDAHGGNWDRQVSIFPIEALDRVPDNKREEVLSASYTENITISGLPLEQFTANSTVKIGNDVVIQVKYIGKDEFKEHGRPYIVSREGRFGIVLKGGTIKVGDEISLIE